MNNAIKVAEWWTPKYYKKPDMQWPEEKKLPIHRVFDELLQAEMERLEAERAK